MAGQLMMRLISGDDEIEECIGQDVDVDGNGE